MSNTLEKLKNDYAIESGSENWDDMIEYFIVGDVGGINQAFDEVTKLYTEYCVKASLEKASYNAELLIKIEGNRHAGNVQKTAYIPERGYIISSDKQSIINPDNIVIL